MNLLKSVENAISGLLEGAFGRMFRSEVRPVELARKLAREMDEHREVSVSRTYAPNEYAVWLSPQDRARYEGFEHEVIEELCAYLLEHARQEDLVLATPPQITFNTDDALALGEFGISAQLTRPSAGSEGGQDEEGGGRPRSRAGTDAAASRNERADSAARGSAAGAAAAASAAAGAGASAGETMIWSGSKRVRGPLLQSRERRANAVVVRTDGRREPLAASGATIGRSRACEIVVDDAGVSRQHAAIRRDGERWLLEDLGSTNGTSVNGARVASRQALSNGDEIELGSTKLRFEER